MKSIKRLFAVLLLLCSFNVFAADYTLVDPPQPTHTSKIEVLEFFFYGCIHCFHLEPLMSSWQKNMPPDVEFTYVPAAFNPVWETSGRTFYALEAMGQRAQVHEALFNAWNVSGIELRDQESTAEFLSRNGIDSKKFNDAYSSFRVQSDIARAKQLGLAYKIRGTPTVIVDGRYLITGLQPEDTMRVMESLIEKVRKERAAAAKPAKPTKK
ncbi:MAG: thiol:disulfide interchange protein DsbA/DsbL [Gallionellaceae bacterium]|nr:thiol:disulfide interchange protein DsbA/DsbL [Gallionellaceae bacterium]